MSRENNAIMHPFDAIIHPLQKIMTTSKKGPRSLLRIEIRGEWYIWNTISNTSNTRTNIRNQMTNVPSTPTRKRLTYWKR